MSDGADECALACPALTKNSHQQVVMQRSKAEAVLCDYSKCAYLVDVQSELLCDETYCSIGLGSVHKKDGGDDHYIISCNWRFCDLGF